uniref:SHSP domain-containing protein n=1 Tax=Heterorhabditis bacteriophora TaxID=37862 RepID=A0A1I7WF39_HETBA
MCLSKKDDYDVVRRRKCGLDIEQKQEAVGCRRCKQHRVNHDLSEGTSQQWAIHLRVLNRDITPCRSTKVRELFGMSCSSPKDFDVNIYEDRTVMLVTEEAVPTTIHSVTVQEKKKNIR